MVVLVKCWVKCTYLLSPLFLYIFLKMCTCIIITIPNFRGNLCNKNSMSIYRWDAACFFFMPAVRELWLQSIPHLASTPPAAVLPLAWALHWGSAGAEMCGRIGAVELCVCRLWHRAVLAASSAQIPYLPASVSYGLFLLFCVSLHTWPEQRPCLRPAVRTFRSSHP